MIGGDKNKPTHDDRRIPLDPGTHVVTLDDVISGVSDKTGNQYWICKMLTENEVQFDHFIQCVDSEYKTIEKVFNSAAVQMDALMLYDKIGEQKTYSEWFTKAIDLTYELKGKKIEYTVQKWKIDGKEGTWGKISGYLDIPNEAIQNVPKAVAGTVDPKEKLPF